MAETSSIEDQIRKCRDYAAARGWEILEEYVRVDRAISGAALTGRDALQFLVGAAKRRPKPFDCLNANEKRYNRRKGNRNHAAFLAQHLGNFLVRAHDFLFD